MTTNTNPLLSSLLALAPDQAPLDDDTSAAAGDPLAFAALMHHLLPPIQTPMQPGAAQSGNGAPAGSVQPVGEQAIPPSPQQMPSGPRPASPQPKLPAGIPSVPQTPAADLTAVPTLSANAQAAATPAPAMAPEPDALAGPAPRPEPPADATSQPQPSAPVVAHLPAEPVATPDRPQPATIAVLPHAQARQPQAPVQVMPAHTPDAAVPHIAAHPAQPATPAPTDSPTPTLPQPVALATTNAAPEPTSQSRLATLATVPFEPASQPLLPPTDAPADSEPTAQPRFAALANVPLESASQPLLLPTDAPADSEPTAQPRFATAIAPAAPEIIAPEPQITSVRPAPATQVGARLPATPPAQLPPTDDQPAVDQGPRRIPVEPADPALPRGPESVPIRRPQQNTAAAPVPEPPLADRPPGDVSIPPAPERVAAQVPPASAQPALRSTDQPAPSALVAPQATAPVPVDQPVPPRPQVMPADAAEPHTANAQGPQAVTAEPIQTKPTAARARPAPDTTSPIAPTEGAAAPAAQPFDLPGLAAPANPSDQAPAQVAAVHMPAPQALRLTQGETQRLRVQIDPPELGACEIELAMRDGVVHATVTAERPDLATTLQQVQTQVREALAARGLQLGRFDISGGATDQPADDQRRAAPETRPEPTVPAGSPMPVRPRTGAHSIATGHQGRVDLVA